jgi:predicted nuclease with TOPRIM domain
LGGLLRKLACLLVPAYSYRASRIGCNSNDKESHGMSNEAGFSALAGGLSEVRRQLAGEVKARQAVIKPLDQAQRALKDPHKNAVTLHEATALLEQSPEELVLPNEYGRLVKKLRALADENLAELEFTFARDLREAFNEQGLKFTICVMYTLISRQPRPSMNCGA